MHQQREPLEKRTTLPIHAMEDLLSESPADLKHSYMNRSNNKDPHCEPRGISKRAPKVASNRPFHAKRRPQRDGTADGGHGVHSTRPQLRVFHGEPANYDGCVWGTGLRASELLQIRNRICHSQRASLAVSIYKGEQKRPPNRHTSYLPHPTTSFDSRSMTPSDRASGRPPPPEPPAGDRNDNERRRYTGLGGPSRRRCRRFAARPFVRSWSRGSAQCVGHIFGVCAPHGPLHPH